MSVKLAAIGNVLMGDDGIAIAIAKKIEPELNRMGIEVVYGETDVGYCISVVDASDDIIILDASAFGKKPGEITRFELTD
ncbi:MAG TPA: hydrogenase maturation protease [Mobilitalea sp.]|nr:hydrogenase maturation protease [Mobilitalea sp.]